MRHYVAALSTAVIVVAAAAIVGCQSSSSKTMSSQPDPRYSGVNRVIVWYDSRYIPEDRAKWENFRKYVIGVPKAKYLQFSEHDIFEQQSGELLPITKKMSKKILDGLSQGGIALQIGETGKKGYSPEPGHERPPYAARIIYPIRLAKNAPEIEKYLNDWCVDLFVNRDDFPVQEGPRIFVVAFYTDWQSDAHLLQYFETAGRKKGMDCDWHKFGSPDKEDSGEAIGIAGLPFKIERRADAAQKLKLPGRSSSIVLQAYKETVSAEGGTADFDSFGGLIPASTKAQIDQFIGMVASGEKPDTAQWIGKLGETPALNTGPAKTETIVVLWMHKGARNAQYQFLRGIAETAEKNKIKLFEWDISGPNGRITEQTTPEPASSDLFLSSLANQASEFHSKARSGYVRQNLPNSAVVLQVLEVSSIDDTVQVGGVKALTEPLKILTNDPNRSIERLFKGLANGKFVDGKLVTRPLTPWESFKADSADFVVKSILTPLFFIGLIGLVTGGSIAGLFFLVLVLFRK